MSRDILSSQKYGNIPEVDLHSIKNTSTDLAWLDINRIISVLRKWWLLIGLVILVVTGLTAYFLQHTTPIYKAKTMLEVKQEERKIVDVSAVENVNVDAAFLTTQIRLLQSESLIENTIDSLDLLSDRFLFPIKNSDGEKMSREQRIRRLVQNFQGKLRVAPVGRSRLIELSFEHADPKQAALIANTMTETFLDRGLQRKLDTADYAREFLSRRLELVRVSLEKAEQNLVDYARTNNLITVNSEDIGNSSDSLDMEALKILSKELTSASLERVVAQEAYEQRDSGFLAELLDSNAISKLQADKIALEAEYIEKLSIYKPKFPEMLELKERISLFDSEIATLTREVKSVAEREREIAYKMAVSKEKDLSERVKNLKQSVIGTRDKSIGYNILKRQVETERTQYEGLLQRLKEVSVADDLGAQLIEVIDKAQVPSSPFKPNRQRVLLLGFLLSGVLGFGIAYILDLIDDNVKMPSDFRDRLDLPVMGVIPVSKNTTDFTQELNDPQSRIAEAYASLRANLQFSGSDGGPRIIQITSTRSGEGKSVSALGVALRFAGIGKRVLLIDADMRLPTFVQTIEKSIGLSGLLTTKAEFADEISLTQYKNLDLLSSGVTVPNPSELLSGNRFEQLLDFAKTNYDYVVIDGPPVLGLADALILGAKVNGTLLVVEAGQLRTQNVKVSIERLRGSGTKILGGVLTKYKVPNNGYSDYYNYSYGEKDKAYATNLKKQTKVGKLKRKLKITENI